MAVYLVAQINYFEQCPLFHRIYKRHCVSYIFPSASLLDPILMSVKVSFVDLHEQQQIPEILQLCISEIINLVSEVWHQVIVVSLKARK